MALNKDAVMWNTHYGLDIYALILRKYYKDEVVLKLKGKVCELRTNPFSIHSESMQIELKNGVFRFDDTINPELKGDAFDFARLHYKMNDTELMEQLNTEMNLHLDKERSFYPTCNGYKVDEQEYQELPKFSFFKKPISNTKPYKAISVLDAYSLIKGHWNIERTQTLRQIRNVEEARAFKASQFNYVCFSGIFTKRSEKHFQHHSGLMVLDFDHLSDVDGVKNMLLADESLETVLLFRSPSGDGLKWVITIDICLMDHKNYFKAVCNYLKQTYQLEVDGSGKDVARACFLPYDPQVYINPKYLSHEKAI